MSCCGKARAQFTNQFTTGPSGQTPSKPTIFNRAPSVSVQQAGTVTFQYTGRTRLTVIGPVTRARYDFIGHGARLQVDRRDSNSIASVPALRRV